MNNKTSRRSAIAIIATVVAFSLPCFADDHPIGKEPSQGACALVFGGGGTVTPDNDVNSRWFVINSTVSRGVMSSLSGLGYRLEDFIVDIRDPQKRAAAMYLQMRRKKCEKVVQISHSLRGDSEHPNLVTKFAFEVSVLRVKVSEAESTKNASFQIVGDYYKEYEYPMTSEVMDTLSISGLAYTMATDLDKAAVLEKSQ